MTENEQTTSISKGCFLFNAAKNDAGTQQSPSKKRKKSKRKSMMQQEDSHIRSEKKPLLDSGCLNSLESMEQDMFSSIKEMQRQHNAVFSSELVSFVIGRSKLTARERGSCKLTAAALMKGVNMPDHGVLFHQLLTTLRSDVTPYVACLQSQDCPNIGAMMKATLQQLNKDQVIDAEMSDDETATRKASSGSMTDFVNAYLTHAQGQDSTDTKPVVVVMEDVESINTVALKDFLLILSNYTLDVPWIVIFGISTTLNALYACLPHAVSTRLSIRTFYAKPSLESLNEIIDEHLITSKYLFKLGPKVLHILYENFLCHDFSIRNFLNGLKLCLLEHYYSKPLSFLCMNDMDSILMTCRTMSQESLLCLRDLPSVKRYIERKSKSEQDILFNDLNAFQDVALELMSDFVCREARFYPWLHCLHLMSLALHKSPFGKRLLDTFEICLECQITKSPEYSHGLEMLRVLSRDRFTSLLHEFRSVLDDAIKTNRHCAIFKEDVNGLDKFTSRANLLLNNLCEDDEAETVVQPSAKIYKNRFELQEKMRSAVLEKKRTPFEKFRFEAIEFLDGMFRKYLVSPLTRPCHEMFFYDDADIVKERLIAQPRAAVQIALTHPCQYLKCPCCEIEGDTIQDTLPDVAILYKLHVECGRLINLYDWLQAFITVVDPDLSSSKKPTAKQKNELETLQARFIRGVSELQFLGFIKSTKRKTDHVSRLTFGGC